MTAGLPNPGSSGIPPQIVDPIEFFFRAQRQLRVDDLMQAASLGGSHQPIDHIRAIQQMMGSFQGATVDATRAGDVSIHLGRRRVDVPTLNQRARTINYKGTRYAPMVSAVWDSRTRQYVTGDAMTGLGRMLQGIRGNLSAAGGEGAFRGIAKATEQWRLENLAHVRFGVDAAGGALPFYLSHQVSFALTGGDPITAAVGRVDEVTQRAIRSVSGAFRALSTRGAGAYNFLGGQSYELAHHVLAQQLSLTGTVLAQRGIGSIGRKGIKATGYDPLDSGAIRREGQAGRVIASQLPEVAFGLHVSGGLRAVAGGYELFGQLPKSIHHMRARAALPTEALRRLPESASTKRKGGREYVLPALRSGWADDVDAAATEHFAQQATGHVGRARRTGRAIRVTTSTPMLVMGVDVAPNLPTHQAAAGRRILGMMFGDSGVFVGSERGVRFLNINRQQRVPRNLPNNVLTGRVTPTGGQQFALHPVIQEALRGGEVGSPIVFEQGITYEQLYEFRERDLVTGGERARRAGYVGRAIDDSGDTVMHRGRRAELRLRKGEILRGFHYTQGGLRPIIEDSHPRRKVRASHPIMLGSKRVGVQQYINTGGTADFVAAMDMGAYGDHGLGISAFEENFLLTTETEEIRNLRGKKGLRALAEDLNKRDLGGRFAVRTTRINGQDEVFLSYDKNIREIDFNQFREAVRQTRSELGLRGDSALETVEDIETLTRSWFGRLDRRTKRQVDRELRGAGFKSGPRGLAEVFVAKQGMAEASLRAGQPQLGVVGRVRYSLRDANIEARRIASTGAADLHTMFATPDGAKRAARGFTVSSAIRRTAREKRRFDRETRRALPIFNRMLRGATLESNAPGRGLFNAIHAIYRGDQAPDIAGYERITLDEFRRRHKFTNVNYRSGGDLEAFRGTHFVGEVDGRLREGRKGYIIDMGAEGLMPIERRAGGRSIKTRFLVLGSGHDVGLRAGQKTFLRKGAIEGISGVGKEALDLIRLLHGDDAGEAFAAAGRLALSHVEEFGAQGVHAFGKRLKQSFGGRLIIDPNLEVGEIGMSRRNVFEMLRSAGFRKEDAEILVGQIERGEREYFAKGKREPARTVYESFVGRVKILKGNKKVNYDEAVAVNPVMLDVMHGDLDSDPMYVYNIAQGRVKDPKKDEGASQAALKERFEAEQQVNRAVWESRARERRIIEKYHKQRLSATAGPRTTKSAQITSDEYEALYKKFLESLDDTTRQNVNEAVFGRNVFNRALSGTMASAPQLLTAQSNLRWREINQILDEITSRGVTSVEQFMNRSAHQLGDDATKRANDAIAYIRNMFGDEKQAKYLEHFAGVSSMSEYTVLQKGAVLDLIKNQEKFVQSADPRVLAATFNPALLDVSNKQAHAAAIGELADRLLELDKESSVHHISMVGEIAQENARAAAEAHAQIISRVRILQESGVVSSMSQFQQAASTARRGETPRASRILAAASRLLGFGPQHGEMGVGGYHGPVPGQTAAPAVDATPPPSLTDQAKNVAAEAGDAAKKFWNWKYGKGLAIGTGAIMGLFAVSRVFGMGSGAHGTGRPAPLPPSPMTNRPMDRTEIEIPETSMAYIARPAQVRTQMHFNVGTNGGNRSFAMAGDAVFGSMGMRPRHLGSMRDATASPMMRHQIDAEVRKRSRSSF